jgi:NAD(P)-dependent dehydrogenase (short-subunit alcohol dehydrogenase family)
MASYRYENNFHYIASHRYSTPFVGASTGLGREIVIAALARGDRVIATARDTSKVQDLVDGHPESCRSLALDVTDTFDNLRKIADNARGLWGHVDVLVNNAGHFYAGSMEELG